MIKIIFKILPNSSVTKLANKGRNKITKNRAELLMNKQRKHYINKLGNKLVNPQQNME